MNYLGSAVTDIGISKQTNQDSVCVKIGYSPKYGQIAMVVLCDGMGGLEKGELASAAVIKAFVSWFENRLPVTLANLSWNKLTEEWERLVKEQNYRIGQYGTRNEITLGTTVTAMLVIEGNYLIVHIGDSRIYEINNTIKQLTEDHTFIAREIKRGTMTAEQAAKDPRRNMLLQCVGASKTIEPQIIRGQIRDNSVFLFCSDGFRHVLSNTEIFNAFNPGALRDVVSMEQNSKYLIDVVKSRNERDNITVALLKCSL